MAIALKAAKWMCLMETTHLIDEQQQPIRQLTLQNTAITRKINGISATATIGQCGASM
ncbi:MAG: hypothetical protein R3E08_09585 [Thiotrichaceae bacterium]